ncbi:MSMB protein, partial [Thryothorus ludovicianus]|nr:MSMB protein [Thryothorus ludovicianus]
GCMLNGKLYPFGRIERTEDCHACTCAERAMSCCSLFFTSVQHDENCKVLLNRKLCKLEVVRKDDPSKTC